jgi:hypothetical protein
MPGDSRRNVGAANPRALAELRAGRKIDWSKEDEKKTLAQLLDMPYEHLFDPKFGSPVFAGVPLDFGHQRWHVTVDAKTDIRKLYDSAPNARRLQENGLISDSILKKPATNLRTFAAATTDQVALELQSLEPKCNRPADATQVNRSAEMSVAARLTEMSQATLVKAGQPLGRLNREFVIINPEWLHLLLSDLNFSIPGEYFVDAPTATSPVQGGLGDCWLIAAMSSVSWTRPELMNEKIRREASAGVVATGKADFRYDFTDVLTINLIFFNITIPFTFPIWIGEEVPQSSWGGYIYASSSVPGETWPAVIEKAVAVWRSGGNANFPNSSDYGHLNGGDAAWACHILTGDAPWYHWADADDSWSTIISNCSGGRTITPMTAWTWGSSDDSPNKVDYAGANLVANHAYSILGTWETNNRQYVVLRNPWGYHEGTLNTFSGSWSTNEAWGAAPTVLPGSGVFALEIHTFREYFMGFGGAK